MYNRRCHLVLSEVEDSEIAVVSEGVEDVLEECKTEFVVVEDELLESTSSLLAFESGLLGKPELLLPLELVSVLALFDYYSAEDIAVTVFQIIIG